MGQGQSNFDGFSREEVARLEKRFQKLDLDHSGTISVNEFVSAVPGLKENPLLKRVVDVLDSDLSGEIDFKEFVMGLAQFTVRPAQGTDPSFALECQERRLRFIFSIYDMDRDGYISNGELFQVIKMMTGSNLNDSQLQQIVDKTINYLDKDEDGRISFEEFRILVTNRSTLSDVAQDMVVEI